MNSRAGPIGILNNLSELMVHEIEAACERANQRQQVWDAWMLSLS